MSRNPPQLQKNFPKWIGASLLILALFGGSGPAFASSDCEGHARALRRQFQQKCMTQRDESEREKCAEHVAAKVVPSVPSCRDDLETVKSDFLAGVLISPGH